MGRKNKRSHHEEKSLLSPIDGPTENTITLGQRPMSQSYVLEDEPKKDDDKERLP